MSTSIRQCKFWYCNLKLFGWASTLKLLTWLVEDYEMLFEPVVSCSVTHSLTVSTSFFRRIRPLIAGEFAGKFLLASTQRRTFTKQLNPLKNHQIYE